jgi:hypothetical protein
MSYYIFVSDKGKDYLFSDRFQLETPSFDFGYGRIIRANQIYTQKDINIYCKKVRKELADKIKKLKKGHSINIDKVLSGGYNIYLKKLTLSQYRNIVEMLKLEQLSQNIKQEISAITKDLQIKLSRTEELYESQCLLFIDDTLPVG